MPEQAEKPGNSNRPDKGTGYPWRQGHEFHMLPVADKAGHERVVEEAVAVGMSGILIVTGRDKRPLVGPLRSQPRAGGGPPVSG